jgi:type I restriction enzyme M protein
MGKTNPLNDEDLAEFQKLQKTMKDSGKSWTRDVKDLDEETFDLSVKNPDGGEVVVHRKPEQIIKEIQELDKESAEVLAGIKKLL